MDDGTPIITVEHLGDNVVVHSDVPCVSDADRERLDRYSLRVGDIVFSRVGSVDRRALVTSTEDGWLFSGRCIRIRPDDSRVDARYLSYFFGLSSFKNHIRAIAVGATMPSLNTKLMSELDVYLPELSEQRAIAHILGTLDDKIELNRKMNETLEAMAHALFKSWFVDFDPVHAKAEGRDPGLPTEIADLFPDSFEDSELGKIPKVWEVEGLDEVAQYLNGLALQKYPVDSGDDEALPVIKIAQLRKGNAVGASECNTKVPTEYVVDDGDILFSWSGSLEVVIWCGGKGALNQHLFKITSDRVPKWFYYLWTRHHLSDFRHTAAGKATTMGHIQRHHLSDAKVLVPPADLMYAMDGIAAPLIERSVGRAKESRILAALRDTLLPKLLSGDLRGELSVAGAEKEVSA